MINNRIPIRIPIKTQSVPSSDFSSSDLGVGIGVGVVVWTVDVLVVGMTPKVLAMIGSVL